MQVERAFLDPHHLCLPTKEAKSQKVPLKFRERSFSQVIKTYNKQFSD